MAVQPPDGAGAVAVALAAFALLVALLFACALRMAAPIAAAAGALAAAVRLAAFALPQGGISPMENASGGEFALFLVATALLVVIAVVPASALRGRGEGA
jgi:hypothetical protein